MTSRLFPSVGQVVNKMGAYLPYLVHLNALQIRNTEIIPQPTLLYFFFVMKNLLTCFRNRFRNYCPIVLVPPWGAWQMSALWKHLSNVYSGTLSATALLFHVHSCHFMRTGTSKDIKELTQRCCYSL